jgi:hypothetical protein
MLAQLSLVRRARSYTAVWLPLSALRDHVEFTILQHRFITEFELPHDFDFGLYMRVGISFGIQLSG